MTKLGHQASMEAKLELCVWAHINLAAHSVLYTTTILRFSAVQEEQV